MKFILALVICSQVQQTCLPPYQWPDTFNSQYDCLMFGYEESAKKMKEIGREDINKYNMYIKFYCTPQQTISYQTP
jgi:thiaminase